MTYSNIDQQQELEEIIKSATKKAYELGYSYGYATGYSIGQIDGVVLGYAVAKTEEAPAVSDGLRKGSSECGKAMNNRKKAKNTK